MKLNRKRKALLIIALFIAPLVIVSNIYNSGPWRGKVIDADTKVPIQGAVVVALWEKWKYLPLGPYTDNLDVEETVTNNNGEFELPAKWFMQVPVFRDVRGPLITIFKPGYGFFPVYQASPDMKSYMWYEYHKIFLGKIPVVELRKWKTLEERKKHPVNTLFHNIPETKYRQLLKAAEEDYKEISRLSDTKSGE